MVLHKEKKWDLQAVSQLTQQLMDNLVLKNKEFNLTHELYAELSLAMYLVGNTKSNLLATRQFSCATRREGVGDPISYSTFIFPFFEPKTPFLPIGLSKLGRSRAIKKASAALSIPVMGD